MHSGINEAFINNFSVLFTSSVQTREESSVKIHANSEVITEKSKASLS